MKILWVKSDFLHPTTRGGQIRTLEMLRRLHTRHEVHYVAFDDPSEPEGLRRSQEYCTHAYPISHSIPPRRSARFVLQLARGLWEREPVSISRYRSNAMRKTIEQLTRTERFDCVVCDFLTPAVNVPALDRAVLFQHNVETLIWERHASTATNVFARAYLRLQAEKMQLFEQRICRTVRHIIAVSHADADMMKMRFGVSHVSAVPTGVDVEFFTPTSVAPNVADLVFVGSMDWLPNIDAIRYFVGEVLPLIRKQKANCSVAIVGRKPSPEIQALARDPDIEVTGTVADVRPYLWGCAVAIVPLRIGGGTRLKIYEAMAAKTPVVSTSIGAEGLAVKSPDDFRMADTAAEFADQCLALLNDEHARRRMAATAWHTVSTLYSWDAVIKLFEAEVAAISPL